MSAENDVPLGEESRRYYEQQFGDRIRKVSKRGGSPNSAGGKSNWNGRVGTGIGLAIGVAYLVLRILLAVARTDSSTPSYTYTPPQANFNVDWPVPNAPNKKAVDPSLEEEDVPLLAGLCYRIHQESLEPQATPGGRIRQLLDDDTNKLIVKAAEGQKLNEEETDTLLEALNEVLRRPDFYNASLGRVPGVVTLVLTHGQEHPAFNRLVLEKCYPSQIVPLSKRGQLVGAAREEWRRLAQTDLEQARRKYENAKRE